MWKKCNVVMFATNKKAQIGSFIFNKNAGNKANTLFMCKTENTLANIKNFANSWITQHLYITSDEEIKEGDWFLSDTRNNRFENNELPIYELFKCTSISNKWICINNNNDIGKNPNWCIKIIATTDKSLSTPIKPCMLAPQGADKQLPQPSKQFIEKYIEEYNKGNIITEVDVEYKNEYDWSLGEDAINFPLGEIIKINQDNTINIKPIKNSWTREEVVNLLYKSRFHKNSSEEKFDKWIEENL